MAFTVRRWLAMTLAGMVLTAAWRLPVDTTDASARMRMSVPPEMVRQRQLSGELRRTHRLLQQVRWIDSLVPLVIRTAVDGLAVTLPMSAAEVAAVRGADAQQRGDAEAAHPDGLWTRFHEAVRQEHEAARRPSDTLLPPGPGTVVVGYIYQPLTHGLEAAAPHDPRSRRETYVGTYDGTGYCLRVATMDRGRVVGTMAEDTARVGSGAVRQGPDDGRAGPEDDRAGSGAAGLSGPAEGPLLGPCGFYARHGLAGPRIQSWLESGAIALADARVDESREVIASSTARRSAFGLRLFGPVRPVEIERCLAGHADACTEAFLDPQGVWHSRGLALTAEDSAPLHVERASSPLHDMRGLLSDLEAEFGPDAFGRFWTSDLDVREAFEAAFEVDLTDWLMSWVDRSLGIEPSGPALPRSAALGSMLAIGLLAALATRRHRRRAIG